HRWVRDHEVQVGRPRVGCALPGEEHPWIGTRISRRRSPPGILRNASPWVWEGVGRNVWLPEEGRVQGSDSLLKTTRPYTRCQWRSSHEAGCKRKFGEIQKK